MSTVAKGSARKAHRQPGQASKSIPSQASSDTPPKSSTSSRKGAPGNPVGVSQTVNEEMRGHGNAGLSGVDDKQ